MRIGNLLIVIGAALVVIGLLVRYVPGALGWFGRLPGDIRVERDTYRLYVPLASMAVVSLVLSLILAFIRRLHG